MVPLDTDRFRAVFAESGFSGTNGKAKLANALHGETQRRHSRQWVASRLKAAGVRRCRQSTRRALSRLLDVPDEWLAGETVVLPITAAVHLNLPIQTDPTSPAMASLNASPAMSLRLQLATVRLLNRCVIACSRDLDRLTFVDETTANADQIRYEVLTRLVSALLILGSARRWQSALLQSGQARRVSSEELAGFRDGRHGSHAYPPISRDEQAVSLRFVHALESLLSPWLEGQHSLNYGRLRAVHIAFAGAAMLPQSVVPKQVQRANGILVHLADRFSPLALIGWEGEHGTGVDASERNSLDDMASPDPSRTSVPNSNDSSRVPGSEVY